MLALAILFLLFKTPNYMSLLSLFKKGQSKNVQNFLAKDWCIKTNIKQKAKIQLRQVSIDSFSNQTLYEPTDVYFGLLKHLCNTKR